MLPFWVGNVQAQPRFYRPTVARSQLLYARLSTSRPATTSPPIQLPPHSLSRLKQLKLLHFGNGLLLLLDHQHFRARQFRDLLAADASSDGDGEEKLCTQVSREYQWDLQILQAKISKNPAQS